MAHPDLDYALGEEILLHIDVGGCTKADRRSLREVRSLLENVENQLSYVRRVAQSRIDLARSELTQRTAGRSRSDLADVIRRLPEVLSEKSVPRGLPRFANAEIEPDPVYMVDVDDVVPPVRMLEVGQLGRGDLREIIVRLEGVEARTSVQRSIVQQRLDDVHRAVVSQYDGAVR